MAPGKSSPSASTGEISSNGSDASSVDATLWRLETIQGKGRGLLATRDISSGTLLLSDPPLLTTDVITSIETTEQDLARALRALPKDSQRAFLSLHNNFPGKNPLSNIIRSNGYPLGPSSNVGGVFLRVASLNHSCRPNAKHTWNSKLQRQTVYAIRPIAAGEELTLSYLQGGTSTERQRDLQTYFNFTCTCTLCALPTSQRRASDNRLRRAQQLTDAMGDWDACRHAPARVLADGHALQELYREEDIADDRLANLYYDLFQVCAMHADAARASAFARRYCELKERSEGPDSTDVAEVQTYARDPRRHGSFGRTQNWEQDMGRIPSGVDEESFEKWLWREDT